MKKAKSEAIEGQVLEAKPRHKAKISPEPKKLTKTNALSKAGGISVIAGLQLSTDELKLALDAQTEQRLVIADFVKKHLKKGTDYIRIHVVKKDNCPAESKRAGSCRNTYHFSKDVLAKPGQEKIFSLFQLTSELIKDEETMAMLEGQRNLVAYKCTVRRGDKIVAEGRGAAIVGDNRRDVNATIKIAEKRARMDACLALGFSEYFAQDLDDPDYQNQKRAAEEEAAGRADDGTGLPMRPAKSPIDDQERTVLAKWLMKRGFDDRQEQLELLRINGIDDPKKMTSKQARDMILKLQRSSFAAPAGKEDSIADGLFGSETAPAEETPKEPPQPIQPALVVDDELKSEVQARADTMGLNEWGKKWLMQMISGRPFTKWEKLNPDEWRKAYDIVMGILDQSIHVDDRYIAGVVKDSKDKEQS